MSVAAYLTAGRRVPGAWLLMFSINGLLQWLNSVIVLALVDSGEIAARAAGSIVNVPYALLVLALGLLLLAGFQRWKTLGEFGESLQALGRKLKKIQEIE